MTLPNASTPRCMRLIFCIDVSGLVARSGARYVRSSSSTDTSHIRFLEEPVREGTSLRAEDEREARVFAGGTGRPQARAKGEAPHFSASACTATDVASLLGVVLC